MITKKPAPKFNNRRQEKRVASNLPIELKLDAQVTVTGTLKDLSPRSAFVKIRESAYVKLHDEIQFFIRRAGNDVTNGITGRARITRIAEGEGIGIYFIAVDKKSVPQLEQVLWG